MVRHLATAAALAAVALLDLVRPAFTAPVQPLDLADLGINVTRRADPSLAGYLGAFFLGADPYVYLYLSDGNNAISFKALNRGSPVLRPTAGTKGVRDPAIVVGGGAEAGNKWYMVGTDLDIGKVGRCRRLGWPLLTLPL